MKRDAMERVARELHEEYMKVGGRAMENGKGKGESQGSEMLSKTGRPMAWWCRVVEGR
jgi:hypothetical protein